MKNIIRICGYFIICIGLFSNCSTTKNLPEEEVLYTGIKEINYGQKAQKKKRKLPKKVKKESSLRWPMLIKVSMNY